MNKNTSDIEESSFASSKQPLITQEPDGSLEKEGKEEGVTIPLLQPLPTPAKLARSIKPGSLPNQPPTSKEWKASGKRGLPPVAYEVVIKDAPNHSLEYELYHGFRGYVSYREVEQRIGELEKQQKGLSQRYTRAAIYYLQRKLEEYVVGD